MKLLFSFCIVSAFLHTALFASDPTQKTPDPFRSFFSQTSGHTKSGVTSLDDRAFIRRIWLDLAGRLPSSQHVHTFMADNRTTKYADEINQLLDTEMFTDRWTTFYADIFKNFALLEDLAIYRNAFYENLRRMVATKMPWDQMAREILAASGRGDSPQAAMFFWSKEAFEEIERLDYLDDQTGWVTDVFLGVETNCISCHDGAGHLEQVNQGLSKMTRKQFWGMAAFLSSAYLYEGPEIEEFEEEGSDDAYFRNLRIGDKDLPGFTGNSANTNLTFADDNETPLDPKFLDGQYHADSRPGQGMRPPRQGGMIEPVYPFTGAQPKPGESRRQALARILTADRQFARNMVNRIWAQLFGEGFVEPHSGWDLARVDPATAQMLGLTVQPKNSFLVEFLTDWFIQNNFDVRGLIRLITNSKVYQWDYLQIQSGEGSIDASDRWGYWRDNKRVRRLEAEAIVESYYQVLGITPQYLVFGIPGKVHTSAWQMPDPSEPSDLAIFGPETDGEPDENLPQSIAGVNVEDLFFHLDFTQTLLREFGRGQYFTGTPRNDEVAIQNALVLMNSDLVNFWLQEPELAPAIQHFVGAFSRGELSGEQLIRDLYRHILYRDPTPAEKAALMAHMAARSPQRIVGDIFWVLLNHPDFIFK